MKKFVAVLFVLSMIVTGCSNGSKNSISTPAPDKTEETPSIVEEPKTYGAGLYKIGEAEVKQDLVTGDLFLANGVYEGNGHYNTVYIVYKYRDGMSSETIAKLKEFGYKDPFEKQGLHFEKRGE